MKTTIALLLVSLTLASSAPQEAKRNDKRGLFGLGYGINDYEGVLGHGVAVAEPLPVTAGLGAGFGGKLAAPIFKAAPVAPVAAPVAYAPYAPAPYAPAPYAAAPVPVYGGAFYGAPLAAAGPIYGKELVAAPVYGYGKEVVAAPVVAAAPAQFVAAPVYGKVAAPLPVAGGYGGIGGGYGGVGGGYGGVGGGFGAGGYGKF